MAMPYQAAVLLSKLGVFEQELERRAEIAARYTAALRDAVVTPIIPAGSRSAFALYTIRVPNRDAVRARLDAAGIGTGLLVPTENMPWPLDNGQKRRAAVSAYGLSGTNVHAIVEQGWSAGKLG